MAEHVRSRIMRAARAWFGRHGFRKTSLADIAGQARIGKSSIYHYFASKEELFREVVSAEMDVLWKRIREAVSREESPEAKLKAFVLTRTRVLRGLANAYASLHEEYLDHLGFVKRLREQAFQAEVDMVRRIEEEGVQTGAFEIADVGAAARTVALALKGLEYPWMVDSQEAKLDYTLSALVGMLMKAIRK